MRGWRVNCTAGATWSESRLTADQRNAATNLCTRYPGYRLAKQLVQAARDFVASPDNEPVNAAPVPRRVTRNPMGKTSLSGARKCRYFDATSQRFPCGITGESVVVGMLLCTGNVAPGGFLIDQRNMPVRTSTPMMN